MGDLLADRADSDRVRPDSAPIRPPSGAGGAPFPEARHRGARGTQLCTPQTNRKGPLQGLPPRTVPRIDPAHAMAKRRAAGPASPSPAAPSPWLAGRRLGFHGGHRMGAAGPSQRPPPARRTAVSVARRSPNMLRQPVKRGSSGAAGVGVDRTVAGGAQRPRQGAPFRAAHRGERCRVPLARRALPSRAPSRTCSRARAASASRS